MPELKTVWIRNAEGERAQLLGNELDTWKLRGWSESTEPTADDGDFVWLQHEVHGGKQRFASAVVEAWGAKGWHPTSPPEPLDLTKSPELVDRKEQPAASDAAPKKSTKAASGGSTKES